MSQNSTEKKFLALCEITRAQHFAWRTAAESLGLDPREAVMRMWEVTGKQTGAAYVRRIDPKRSLPLQLAECVAWSSQCMGEDALVEGTGTPDAWVRHTACPWKLWHERHGVLAECRPGCDRWFQSTVDTVNAALGAKLRVETLEALPDGGTSCLRRFFVDDSAEA